MSGDHDLVLVVDFGAQYAQLIARRVREAHVYSEIVPRSMPIAEMLARQPRAIILSGGPASVHVEGAPSIDRAIYDAGVPLLGICYGAQLVARDLGGEVAKTGVGEYGRTVLTAERSSLLLADRQPGEQVVWMSHFDAMTKAPPGFVVAGRTDGTAAAVIEDRDRGDLCRAVPSGGCAHRRRAGDPEGLPLRRGGVPAHMDQRVDHRTGGAGDP